VTSWYHAVCDEHRERCSIFVAHRDRIETVFPEPAREAAMQFLSDHWNCVLRLFRDDNGGTAWPASYTDRTPP
jgi:hypothetical protein